MPSSPFGRRRFLRMMVSSGALLAAGCGSQTTPAGPYGQLIAWPGKNQWPNEYWQSPATIQAAYHDTIRYADVLRWMPCYCGCEEEGHTSVVDCFVDEFRSDGSVVLDSMGFG